MSMSNLGKPTLFAAIVNSIALGYLYFQKKKSMNIVKEKKNIEETNKTTFKQLIDGNQKHCVTRKKPIAIVITQDSVNVEEIFQMFRGELFIIRDNPDITSYELASQLEYAIIKLGIKTIFTLAHPNDPAVLRFIDVHNEKSDKTIKYALQDIAQERLHNIIQTFDMADTTQLKCYYAVYDQKTGEVRFFHYDELNASNKFNKNLTNDLKESFVLYDENTKIENSDNKLP